MLRFTLIVLAAAPLLACAIIYIGGNAPELRQVELVQSVEPSASGALVRAVGHRASEARR